jgi:hypothetical protein
MMPKREVAKVATEVLAGRLDPLVGCRQLVRRQSELPEPVRESLHFIVLVGIESETDAFPDGEARQRWDPESLVKLDGERDAYVRANVEALRAAMRGILDLCGESA